MTGALSLNKAEVNDEEDEDEESRRWNTGSFCSFISWVKLCF